MEVRKEKGFRIFCTPSYCSSLVYVGHLHSWEGASPGPSGTSPGQKRTKNGPKTRKTGARQSRDGHQLLPMSPFMDKIHLGNLWAAFLSCFDHVLPFKWCPLVQFGPVGAQIVFSVRNRQIGRKSAVSWARWTETRSRRQFLLA